MSVTTKPAAKAATTKATKAPAAKAKAPAAKATTKATAAKATAATKAKAKAPAARPVPTAEAPLASGWIRQSTLGPDAGAASRFTTQAQRRLLRTIVRGESYDYGEGVSGPIDATRVAAPTLRSIERLRVLGYVSIAKSGAVAGTKAGTAFVEANPAPIVRTAPAPKAPAKAAAKAKAPAKPKATKAPAKAPAKAAPKRTVRRSAKAGA